MSNVEEKKCTIIDTNSGEEKEIDVSDLTKIITDRFDYKDILEAFDKIKTNPETTSKVILTFE